MSAHPLWFHIDMDAFFAAVELLDHPEWQGKPLIVGGLPDHPRGVVSTASYEARAFGVRSAMPISQAYRLCPQGIFVVPHFHRYQVLSQRVFELLQDWTPRLIQVSIDEAFLDMSGTRRLLGEPAQIVANMKRQVYDETGLRFSVGVASNKYVAKICSGFQKPDGLTIVPEGEEPTFMRSLKLSQIWGMGKKTQEHAQFLGIRSVDDLLQMPLAQLRGHFGKAGGEFLYKAIRGQDPGIYEGEAKQHSLSSETTFEQDIRDRNFLEHTLLQLANNVMFRLLEEKASSRVVFLKLRLHDFTTVSVQKKLSGPIRSIETFHGLACELLENKWDGHTPVRLIGLGFDQVVKDTAQQQELFEDPDIKKAKVEQAVLGIKARFSSKSIQKASLLSADRKDGTLE